MDAILSCGGPHTPFVEMDGLMVAFGTGRTMTEQDRASVERQTFYAVLDKTRYKASGSSVEVDNASANDRVQDRTSLRERKYTSTSVTRNRAASGLTYSSKIGRASCRERV